MNKNVDFALRYAQRLLPVFPCHSIDNGHCTCGRSDCKSPGKHPLTPNGFGDATTDEETIRAWWERWPWANIAIRTGNKLIVVDVDVKNNGIENWNALISEHGELPETPVARTGGGGLHFYLRCDEDIPSGANVLATGVDIRCAGGYVLAPPSNHLSGEEYRFLHPWHDKGFAIAPDWVLSKKSPKKGQKKPGKIPDEFLAGERNEGLAAAARKMNRSTMDLHEIYAGLQALNRYRCKPPLDDEEVLKIAESNARYHLSKIETETDLFEKLSLSREFAQKCNSDGTFVKKATEANLARMLLVEFGEKITYNELTSKVEIDGRAMTDSDSTGIVMDLEQKYDGVQFKKTQVFDVAQRIATFNKKHPVREFLKSGRWDGIPRLANAARTIFKREEPIYSVVLSRFIVSAVARAVDPGCKVDTLLVIMGRQGSRKSSFCEILGGEWFVRVMPEEMQSKDSLTRFSTNWIVEIQEFDKVNLSRDASSMKALLSNAKDEIRKPYERAATTLRRTSVIIGTTNERSILVDTTGDRRFWIIPDADSVDYTLFAAERDQILFEAFQWYKDGYKWWLTNDEDAEIYALKDEFRQEDPWEQDIIEFADRHDFVTVNDIFTRCLLIEKAKRSRNDMNRIFKILRKSGWEQYRMGHLKVKGWKKKGE